MGLSSADEANVSLCGVKGATLSASELYTDEMTGTIAGACVNARWTN
jgi:hypothetical protein